MIHYMNLQKEPFRKIKNGQKTIESRLLDDKRKKIRINDIIEFHLKNNESQIIKTKVVELHKFDGFNDLITSLGAEKFGWDRKEKVIKRLRKFYSPKSEKELGVLGIEIKKI